MDTHSSDHVVYHVHSHMMSGGWCHKLKLYWSPTSPKYGGFTMG